MDVAITGDTEKKLLEHLSFEKMKENRMATLLDEGTSQEELDKDVKLFRQGEEGSWRKVLTPDYAEKFDNWTKEKLACTDFSVVSMFI